MRVCAYVRMYLLHVYIVCVSKDMMYITTHMYLSMPIVCTV